jgi:hypothetical protein
LVSRSVTWASWHEELLAPELQEVNAEDFDFSLTGFDAKEIRCRTRRLAAPGHNVGQVCANWRSRN